MFRMPDLVRISFIEATALMIGEKHFPVKTPRRWHLIAEYVAKCVAQLSEKSVTPPTAMLIGKPGSSSPQTPVPFQSTAAVCRMSFQIISTFHQEFLGYAQFQADILLSDPSLSAFKPVVLLLNTLTCCDKPVYLK